MKYRHRGWVSLALALAVAPWVAAATGARGRIVDATTGEGVPYVNVGDPRVALGTVGDDRGRFELAGAGGDAVLVFSAIGYATRSVAMVDFPADGVIRLEPVEIGFRETVSVSAAPTGRPKLLGRRYPERGFAMGFGSALLGSELGARIRISKPTYVESANFTVARIGGENFLYRVNIYAFEDGRIGKNLLTRNVLLADRQRRGTLTVDLREHGLILTDDVLLALEWVRADAEAGNANVMFRAKPRSGSNVYLKPTSQMPFSEVPRHSLGFHFIGYTLD